MKRILHYLERTRKYKLTFGKVLGGLGSQPHWHSISGYVIILNSGAVAFGSTKQGIIALSTAEAECIALVLTTTTAIFICNLLSEIIRPFNVPLVMHCNNQAVIAISKTGQYHSCSKHINMKFKFVRKAIEQGSSMSSIVLPTTCPWTCLRRHFAHRKFSASHT